MDQKKYKEVAEKIFVGELSQMAAAEELGVGRSTLVYYLNRDYPDRKKGVLIKKENRKFPYTDHPGRPKGTGDTVSNISAIYTDETLCEDLNCRRCPHNSDTGCIGNKGLIKDLLKRVKQNKGETT